MSTNHSQQELIPDLICTSKCKLCTFVHFHSILQVLSATVANALEYYGDDETSETRNFIGHFDRFFDCLNVRCTSESVYKRKPDLRPYRDPSDSRLCVSGSFDSYNYCLGTLHSYACMYCMHSYSG